MNVATKPVMPAVMPTYRRNDIAFERGEGPYLFGTDGKRFLDFACGLAVTGLGHAHPYLVKALETQAHKLWHVSNLYRIPEQERLAQRLVDATFADTVFFTNSGAEANECAIKVTRRYQFAKGHPEKFRIITFEGAFHGRTLAALAATGNEKYLEGFGPPMPGFVLLVRDRADGDPLMRIGITVSKKVGGAVVRNRMKRRFRALARALLPELGVPGADHVLIGRNGGIERPFGELQAELAKALAKVKR